MNQKDFQTFKNDFAEFHLP